MSEATVSHFPERRRGGAIISDPVDFFLVGGLTFIVFPLTFLPFWQAVPAAIITGTAFYIAFIINNPHFIHSYQLIYENFTTKLREAARQPARLARLLIAGVISPIIVGALMIYGVMHPESQMLSYIILSMYILVGWHTVKQGYGTMLVLAGRKSISFTVLQKRIILFNTYAVWAYVSLALVMRVWISEQLNMHPNHIGVAYHGFNVPAPLLTGTLLVALASTLLVIGIFAKKIWKREFPFIGFIAYVMPLYLWIPATALYYDPYYLVFVNIFHSLQYLPFTWKISYEKARDQHVEKEAAEKQVRNETLKFIAIGFVGGFMLYMVPYGLDRIGLYDVQKFGSNFFFFCVLTFTSLHHYFIDFAIWRRDNPEMRYLFK